MKKLISGTLLLTMTSCNIAYAEPIENYSDNIVGEQIISKNIAANRTVIVNSYNDLKQYENDSDIIIEINSHIKLDDKIEFKGNNVEINGNGYEIDINESNTNVGNKFIIKGTNVSINNISIKNYITTGILLHNSQNTSISDIKLIGNDRNKPVDDWSKVGIDLSNSTATLKNIESKNHRYSGIRLRNESEITIEGINTHNNDVSDLESQVLKDGNDNKINDNNNIYTNWEEKFNNQGTKSTIYKVKTNITVNTLNELRDAIKVPNSIITLNKNIVLDSNLEINQKNITIKGNGTEIDLNGGFCLIVKSTNNVVINDLSIKNYKSPGFSIYSADNIELNNIELIGNDSSLEKDERSKVGLDIYSSKVKLNNIVSKNHLYRGIQVRKEST
ncbi:MAG: hypothetical protein ACI398_09725, partial [Clostridium sp.]